MLINSITEIKSILPVGAGNDFMRLKPHIINAENKFIKPLLGTAMYDELLKFYDASPLVSPTEVQIAMSNLLSKVQHSIIHLAYFVGYDFLNISASDTGFQRLESEHKKGLYKYQEDNLKQYFSDAGYNGLDTILVFVEDNIQYFTEFKSSANWTVFKQSFIPTVKTLQEIPFNIFDSRLTFLNLKPHIAFIEDTTIRKALGDAIYTEIKSEMVKDNPSEKVLEILPYIRKPLIYLASALLMEETGAVLGNNGLYFNKTDSSMRNTTISQPSTEERILAMIKRNRMIGNSYLDALQSFLLANSDVWENFTALTGSVFNRDNTDKKTFWV